MRRWVVGLIAVGSCAVVHAAAAGAHGPQATVSARCAIGDSGVSYNQRGEGAAFQRLRAMRGMNCASARYVLNNWLRRAYEQGSSHRLPTRFYDGYVTWYCGRLSGKKWRCDEYESNTAFRFRAFLI